MGRGFFQLIILFFISVLGAGDANASLRGDCSELIKKIRVDAEELNSIVDGAFSDSVEFWLDGVEQFLRNGDARYLEGLLKREVPDASSQLQWLKVKIKERLKEDRSAIHLRNFLKRLEAEPKPVSYLRWLQLIKSGVRALDWGLYDQSRSPEPTDEELIERETLDPALEYSELQSPLALVWIVRQSQVQFANFNALSPFPIFLYGLIDESMNADGGTYLPSRFFDHDGNHNHRISEKVRSIYPGSSLRELRKFLAQTLHILRFELRRHRFMEKIEEPEVREAFEALYFSLWHESSDRPNPEAFRREATPEMIDEYSRRLKLRSRSEDMGRRSDASIEQATKKWREFLSDQYRSKTNRTNDD